MNFITENVEYVGEMYRTLRRMNFRTLLQQAIQLGLIVTSALTIWKSLILATGSESPVVVVLSGSMEPGFYRGDILFLNMGFFSKPKPFETGEIVVFSVSGREIPIVHRLVRTHERADKKDVDMLTKGDNNYMDDVALYAEGQQWLNNKHLMGRAVGYLPKVGIVTILMNDYPMLKYALIGILGILVITNKEEQ